jgi:succinoglycan biosynthesis transport protein ExoP
MNAPDGNAFDLRQLMRVLSRRRLLLLAPWGGALAIGIAAALLLPPVYLSSVTLLMERPQLNGPIGGMVKGIDPGQQAEIMREQVQSSLFLRSVIGSTGLKDEPQTRAWALKKAGDYPGMTAEEQIDAALVEHLRQAITIRRGKGNIFQIVVGDSRPDRAKVFAEAVANQFVISSKAAQLEAVRATQEFSIEQQAVYKQKLEESERRFESFQRGVLTSNIGSSSVSEGNGARARSHLEQADLDVEEQEAAVSRLRESLRGQVQPNDPALLSSSETNTLSAQLNGLERQLATSLLVGDTEGGDGAAARMALARKVSELETKFAQNAAIALPALPAETRSKLVRLRLAQADLSAKQARRTYLAGQVGGYEQRVVMAPDRETDLHRLRQEVENNRLLYNSFLQQSAQSQIAEAFENAKISGRFEVLEPANYPRKPGKPNRPLLIVLSLIMGGVVGVGIVMVVEQHDQSMKDAEEVEDLLGLPVLGAVPRVDELQRRRNRRSAANAEGGAGAPRDPGLLHRLKVESPLGLEFRRIYLKIKARGALGRTLLVTSSTRGEGKTTTSACLGITIAREMRDRMLLVDFDLRSPALHRALGLPSSSWGLSQMLHQGKFDERFVRSTVQPNLDFLAAGRSERPAADLVDSERVEWFLREALARYAFVLLDAPPTLAVPDPLILGRSVDGVIYVIKAGATIRKAAEYGVKVQRESRDNLIGVLMNDAGEIMPHYYGYHDAYGYGASEVAGGES